MEPNHKNFDCIDLLKYIMAYAVVTIHIGAIRGYEFVWCVEWFIRQAVPFFFIVSGFLIKLKAEGLKGDMLRQFYLSRGFKLLRLWALWMLVYMPLSIALAWGEVDFQTFVKSFVITAFLRGESAVAWPLWFVYAMAFYCFAMALTARHRIACRVFAAACVVLSFIAYLRDIDTSNTLPKALLYLEFCTTRNFGGAFYILIGALIYKMSKLCLKPMPGAALIVFSAVMYFVNAPFWQAAGGAGVAILCLCIELPGSSCWHSMRVQSMWIFYVHMYVLWSLPHIGLPAWTTESILSFTVTSFLCCGLLACGLARMERVPAFRFLRYLVK